MTKDPSYYEDREADIPAIAAQMVAKAEDDLASPMSDILHAWDELAAMGINTATRDDFLKMLEIVQTQTDRPFHPEARIDH